MVECTTKLCRKRVTESNNRPANFAYVGWFESTALFLAQLADDVSVASAAFGALAKKARAAHSLVMQAGRIIADIPAMGRLA